MTCPFLCRLSKYRRWWRVLPMSFLCATYAALASVLLAFTWRLSGDSRALWPEMMQSAFIQE